MSTIRLLRARLNELLVAQPLLVQDAARLVLSIPQVIDSQVYGLVLRKPLVFITFLQCQLRLAGHDLPSWTTPTNDLNAQIDELRTFIFVHLHRVNLHDDAGYSLITQFPEGFALPGESHNLDFAEAFLTVADALLPGHNLTNDSADLIHFARAFISTACRADPGMHAWVAYGGEPCLAVSWFIICLYTGSSHISNCNPAMISADDTATLKTGYRSIAHTFATMIVRGSLESLGDVAKQFRRTPGIALTESRPLPEGLENLSLHLWQQLTFSEQEIASLLGRQIHQAGQSLWYNVFRYEKAFFAYCRQIAAGSFDASAFETRGETRLTNQLMQFIVNDRPLQNAIEGVRFLHNPPNNADGMQSSAVHEWNARLFVQWKTQTGYDDHHDIDIWTENALSTQLLQMALASRSIDVQLLATEEEIVLDDELNAPFPGFEATETSDTSAGPEDDFSVICLFCTSRLSDSEQSGGELVYNLPCCGGRAGAVCLEAYKQRSPNCPFCSQAM